VIVIPFFFRDTLKSFLQNVRYWQHVLTDMNNNNTTKINMHHFENSKFYSFFKKKCWDN
jgi:hypothetical protein